MVNVKLNNNKLLSYNQYPKWFHPVIPKTLFDGRFGQKVLNAKCLKSLSRPQTLRYCGICHFNIIHYSSLSVTEEKCSRYLLVPVVPSQHAKITSLHYKVWGEVTYPFSNFTGAAVEVWEWIQKFQPTFYWPSESPMLELKSIHVNKWGLVPLFPDI